jgi:hypothetical protein
VVPIVLRFVGFSRDVRCGVARGAAEITRKALNSETPEARALSVHATLDASSACSPCLHGVERASARRAVFRRAPRP